MKVAIVHDWLETYAGAERALAQMLQCFPDADVFSMVDFMPAEYRGFLAGKTVRTSFIQRLPFARRRFRLYLPLMPLAVEQLDMSPYDIVISSSHAVAKGVLTSPRQLHICYCYTPIRYAWHMQENYLNDIGGRFPFKRALAGWVLHHIRNWDVRTANGVDAFLAISEYVKRRIWKVYRRDATVMFPPVEIETFTMQADKEDFYLTVSRMTPYKRVEEIVTAFRALPDAKLIVIGDGPNMRKVREAAGPNAVLLGYQPRGVVLDHMRRAKAFVFAAEEDFGIAPVEAQACGTPVIAYGNGGTSETIRGEDAERPTGLFFDGDPVAGIRNAVRRFEASRSRFDPRACRENALRFGDARFRAEFKQFVTQAYATFREKGWLPPA